MNGGEETAGRLRVVKPLHVARIGRELAVAWEDGREDFFELEFLRRACPCAACGGEPDVLGRVIRPEKTYAAGSFEMEGFDFVGGYAIQPVWADGHRTGIFSWNYLRRLAGAQAGGGG